MDLYRHVVQVSIFVLTIFSVGAWKCETLTCIIYPLSLKLWKNHIEVSARSLKVKAGSSFSITCDGSCVGSQADPHLSWYGPDKHRIVYEGAKNRIHVEQSFSQRYLRLHIHKAVASDQGEYICRGWLGWKRRWDMKSIRVIVEPSKTPVPTTTAVNTITTTHSPTEVAISSTSSKTTTLAPPPTTTTATETTVTEEQCYFRCGSGVCIDQNLVCDAFPDCDDQTDEASCAGECSEGMKACEDGYGCVQETQICDGTQDCTDGSDEDHYVCRTRNSTTPY